ncbi:MAG: isochorismatase family protein [Caulobacteraceae bacterium]|nr:isochorismatase family protein [Caulobacteraceae bacterium]
MSTLNGAVDRQRWTSGAWLICLDLQREYVIPGRPFYTPAGAEVAAACARVLAHARTMGWRVVHSQLRRAGGCFGPGPFGAPIEGLRPLISEPVFLRRGLSAFSNPDFALELHRARGEDVFLIGFSLADTCLATTLAALDQGLDLALVEDAVGVGGGAAAEAPEIARAVLRPLARLVSSRDLVALAMEVVP